MGCFPALFCFIVAPEAFPSRSYSSGKQPAAAAEVLQGLRLAQDGGAQQRAAQVAQPRQQREATQQLYVTRLRTTADVLTPG